jgi:hypothetical protein
VGRNVLSPSPRTSSKLISLDLTEGPQTLSKSTTRFAAHRVNGRPVPKEMRTCGNTTLAGRPKIGKTWDERESDAQTRLDSLHVIEWQSNCQLQSPLHAFLQAHQMDITGGNVSSPANCERVDNRAWVG